MDQKVVVITGAGIGAALAEAAAKRGASPVLVARRVDALEAGARKMVVDHYAAGGEDP